jgi:hypothetical protein
LPIKYECTVGTYDDKKTRDTTKRNILNPVGKINPQDIFRYDLYRKPKK